ncbi:MAG TPA: hypothetical protein VK747_09480 [Blastocatellia bacterium]|nr:hypothetical protein [Blastocatellia bacterium]
MSKEATNELSRFVVFYVEKDQTIVRMTESALVEVTVESEERD